MSRPHELTRNLVQAGAFLKELRADMRLPEDVRREAHRLLRHYPTVGHIQNLANTAVGVLGPILDREIDPDWCSGYKHGPHRR
ncbi:BPSL0761 family protein [Novilysobacter arseniciresistens]|uniref:BPSL0761 family protein n=1 Tax=Novilysobacter arseniciresistens TaxID=1385522 RepID=UPI0009DE1CCB|nr:BPSL0761 family protein [Lysobacter arseniciresistens]